MIESASNVEPGAKLPAPNSLKILIADDHPLVRTGLIQVLTEAFPHATFAEAGTVAEVLNLIWKQPWDVLVLDITLPGRSGLEALKEIKRSHPKLPVLVVS